MGRAIRYEDAPPGIRKLCEFLAARLEAPKGPHNDKHCMAENWWTEDRMAEGRHFPLARLSQEEGLRFCSRRARDNNIERLLEYGEYQRGEPADLLLHQFTELLPTLFEKAGEIIHAQGIIRGPE